MVRETAQTASATEGRACSYALSAGTFADKSGLSATTDLTVNFVNTATITGTSGATLVADACSDKLTGGKGANVLTGGAGKYSFVFAASDNGQTTGFDQIQDLCHGHGGYGRSDRL